LHPVQVMSNRLREMAAAAALACVLAACGERGQAAAEPEPTAQVMPGDTTEVEVFRPEPQRQALPSQRIYYTLTDYAWYAQGRPLVHEGRQFEPGGRPVSASAEEMQRVGEFEGVEYYARQAAEDVGLYVPVYEGWWLAFRPVGGATTAR
jgi:predicted small lipoprotein YifL